MHQSFTYGCDPEFFAAFKNEGKDFVISPALLNKDCGIKIIGGTEKHPVFIETDLYRWIMDGVAFELNFKSPFNNPMDMWKEIRYALEHLDSFISKISHPEFGKLSLFIKPTVDINPKIYLPRLDDELIKQGFIFGCDADEDAIEINYNCKTVSVVDYLYRHGGGHLHFGNNYANSLIRFFVQFLAITVGNFCMANSPFPKEDSVRVNTYGKAGRFRNQTYSKDKFGTEYRSPSNSWCSFPPEKVEEMFYWAGKSLEFLQNERADILDEFLVPTAESIAKADFESCGAILAKIS